MENGNGSAGQQTVLTDGLLAKQMNKLNLENVQPCSQQNSSKVQERQKMNDTFSNDGWKKLMQIK